MRDYALSCRAYSTRWVNGIYAGGRIDFATARTLSGQSIPTALRPTIQNRDHPWLNKMVLGGQGPERGQPWIVKQQAHHDAGNNIVHGTLLVLRPMDLLPLAR